MQATTLIFMVLVLGVLWGGFVSLLAHSMKAEKRRALGTSVALAGTHGPQPDVIVGEVVEPLHLPEKTSDRRSTGGNDD